MEHSSRAEVGDMIVIEAHRVGASSRTGEILDVLGITGHEHYRVRWEDGGETLFYPSNDAVVHHVQRPVEEPVLLHDP